MFFISFLIIFEKDVKENGYEEDESAECEDIGPAGAGGGVDRAGQAVEGAVPDGACAALGGTGEERTKRPGGPGGTGITTVLD